MVVVPTRHFALVLVATHVRGDAGDGLVDVAVAKAAAPMAWAILDVMVGLQLEAFVTECWVTARGLFIRVMEGGVVFVWRALRSSDGGHASLSSGGTSGRL